ncbi:hypothetical protein C4561_04090 [candidate division WWE3 bacterium]|jgi:hypothetical protein|uniref:Uncharacterized protein n=1 Tax=candidate division WWE3 bacterium TaxID=2053526 RepID=A0A3A4ZJT4_UNCKA|nr:MAG: hypothetical protein C4561_04090 [candidate division WWE3 bacterium]
MNMHKISKVIFDAMLLLVLLGMLVIPIGSFGLMKVGNIQNQEVLSTQDTNTQKYVAPENTSDIPKPKLKTTGVKDYKETVEESTESAVLDPAGN